MSQRRSIPHVAWRDGKPRFAPSATLRNLGYSGKDLKADNGDWMTRGQATDWSKQFCKKLDGERRQAGKKEAQRRRPRTYTLGALLHDFLSPQHNMKMRAGDDQAGKRVQKPLNPKTIVDYRNKINALEQHDAVLFGSAVTALDSAIVYGVFQELWEHRGLAMAKGIIAVVSSAITWGRKTGRVPSDFKPFDGLRFEKPEPRVRVATKAEFHHLVSTADALGWPEVGDMLFLAVFTGQRQGDRLEMTYTRIEALRFEVETQLNNQKIQQSKRGARVEFKFARPLMERLQRGQARRDHASIGSDYVILNEKTWNAFAPNYYQKLYRRIKNEAAKTMPSVKTILEMDLRDTAVTWAALGGSTLPEIVSLTGHSLQSASTVLEHYLARTPELANQAIDKTTVWYDSDEDVAI